MNYSRSLTNLLFAIAAGLFVYAIVARYWTVPSHQNYLELTAQGEHLTAPWWVMLRYLIWVYAYKLSAIAFSLACLRHIQCDKVLVNTAAVILSIYILIAWLPLPEFPPMAFASAGILMSLLFVSAVIGYQRPSNCLAPIANRLTSKQWMLIAATVFIAAIYTLCPLLGVAGYALQPDKMIRWGLEQKANWFAANLVKDFVLVWILIVLSFHSRKATD